MSWFNNSLNTIKGQLTTLAQEVLAETTAEDDTAIEDSHLNATLDLEVLRDTQRQCDQLNQICHEKDNEIVTLRKQITELQNKISDGGSVSVAAGGRTSKSPPIAKNASLEDSWYWEPDNPAVSSGSSTKNENDHNSETSSAAEIVNINLEDVPLESGKDRSSPDRYLRKQNTALQLKVNLLEEEKHQLILSLEELDSQHNLAIQNVLELKTDLQQKLTCVTKDYDALKNEHASKFLNSEKQMDALKKKFDSLQNSHSTAIVENSKLKVDMDNLKATEDELKTLKSLLEKKDNDNVELIERIKAASATADELTEELTLMHQKMEAMEKEIEVLKLQPSCPEKKLSESSSGKQSVDDEFIVVAGAGETGSASPPTKEDLKDKIVQLENRVSELTLENGSFALKLQDSEMEKKLTSSVLKENLEVMQTKCTDSEKKLDDMSAKVLNYEKCIQDIKAEKTEIEQKLQKDCVALAEENQKIKHDLETKLDEGKQIVADLESKLSSFDTENKKLKLVLDISAREKTNAIAEENEKLKDEIKNKSALEAKLSIFTEENQQLRKKREDSARENAKIPEMESKLSAITEENQNLKREIEVLLESKENASEIQLKLVQENDVLLKKLNDLEAVTEADSQTNPEEVSSSYSPALQYEDLRHLFSTYTNVELQENNRTCVEATFKTIRDKIWKIEILEKNLSQMSEEILDLQDNKMVWDHEKKTLEADIAQYIIQCDELMKNNEIFLNELENYKRNKLETIPENNEENLVILETQLEECNNLNRTLEEEYRELNDKISELESEKQDLANQLKTVQDINAELTVTQKEMQMQQECLELEKCNLIFELNEFKADDKSGELDGKLHETLEKASSLENQLERLSKDHADLVAAMQAQKAALLDSKKENAELAKQLLEREMLLTKSYEELKAAQATQQIPDADAMNLLQREKEDYIARIAKLESDLMATADLTKTIESLNFEKNEIIKTLQAKHSENMKYYMEIDRLSQLLQQQQTAAAAAQSKACENCQVLSGNITEMNKQIEMHQDQINFLKEKSDILTTNLLTEQTNQKLLQHDKAELAEQNANIKRDLERLRQHLVELEETHTKETIEMQAELEQTKSTMCTLQDEVSKSSNAYTSASIRANQHAETLQAQYALVTQQRDELLTKLSLAEDKESKNQAALCNLQCALEQFQNDKDNDIKSATQRIRRELQQELDKQAELREQITALNQQLSDAKQGLRAASRLSDQLESSQLSIATLRDEIESLKEQNIALDEKLNCSESSQTDKIDKNLIKSLLIGYVVSESANDKNQVLRMISSLLDFTQTESDKVGLNKQQSRWFGSLIGGAASGAHSKDNLVQAFVQFLEQESLPRSNSDNMPNLLNMTPTPSAAAITAARKLSTASQNSSAATSSGGSSIQPILLTSNVIDEFAPSRNSSSILKDILSDS